MNAQQLCLKSLKFAHPELVEGSDGSTKNCKNLKALLLTLCVSLSVFVQATEESLEFPTEFLATYDLTKRDTHEYNPYILKKTRKSFLELESVLEKSGFQLDGRICIFGYQEEAVPPYTTDWQRVAIDDETMVKTHAGIAAPTKNIFGFMTGFLLKDAEWLQKEWKKPTDVLHVCARPIALFQDSALVFQKHAFGTQFDYMVQTRDRIERALYAQNLKAIVAELVPFWCRMESEAAKTGGQEAVATQDMLFSIDYARALLEGKTPIKKICLGPDITYPIEVLACQKTHATLHAQEFVQKLPEILTPVNNQNTAYIFCSFVDGVGKSTLLNNIQNWKQLGTKFDQYGRCDNSSSQEAQLFNFSDRVFIVDLPAQMSHFVIKPDGSVFTDIETVRAITPELLEEIQEHISSNKETLISDFQARKQQLRSTQKALYAPAPVSQPSTDVPIEQYAHNCVILDVEEIWVPVNYKSNCILWNTQTGKLRVLVPFAQAHSLGLKVVEPEQMLFHHGLSLPMRYESFLADLVKKLKKAEISQICFVDFLSMYPRSSRETIRLNFVLQYLKKIYNQQYHLEHSFYKHRVYKEQELCHLLSTQLDQAADTLVFEAVLRWGLDCLLEKAPTEKIRYIGGDELETGLAQLAHTVYEKNKDILFKKAVERLEPIQQDYYQNYSLDYLYETVVKFSPTPLTAFSNAMRTLFTKQVLNPYMQELWADFANKLPDCVGTIRALPHIVKNGEKELSIVLRMHNECRDERLLKDFIRPLRAQWYAMLAHLLHTKLNDQNELVITNFKQVAPALMLYQHPDGFLYGLQKTMPIIDVRDPDEIKLSSLALFNLHDSTLRKRLYGEFHEIPHCIDWYTHNTFSGLFGYGYLSNSKNKNIMTNIIDIYQQLYIRYLGKPGFRVTATDLWKQFSIEKVSAIRKSELLQKKLEIINPNDPRLPGIKLFVRALATLDMILKDPETKVLVRKGSKSDFSAALQLLEHHTLPTVFGISCKSPLFTDYAVVEPIISWDIINTY